MGLIKNIDIDDSIEIVVLSVLPIDKTNKDNCVRCVVDFLNKEYNAKSIKNEEFYLVGLSNRYQPKYVMQMAGEAHRVEVNLSKFIGFVWKTECKYIVCVHNHPNGVCEPSDDDIKSMLDLTKICEQFDCNLYEDIIITKDGYYEIIEDEERSY